MFKLPAVMKTTAARLSALFLLLFGVCAIFIVIYMTSIAAGIMVAQTERSVRGELRELGVAFERGGLRRLVSEIDRRSRRPGAFVYLITDATGRTLAGNVASLEPGVLDTEGFRRIPFRYSRLGDDPGIKDDEDGPLAIAQVIKLENGFIVLVGRDLGERVRLRSIVQRTLGLAFGVMAIGALLIWFFVGRRALLRIDAVAQSTNRITSGDLSERLPVSTSNDEFDRLSTSLNAMLGRIEQLNVGLREVSDSIAHDLKTPLTRLRNRAEEALRTGKDSDNYRAALEDMLSESDKIIDIFNSMLLISRVEAGYVKFTPEPVDLAAIAQDLAELYEPVVEDAGGRLENNVSAPLIVSGNRELIGQAITNLLDNAVKYGLPDGDTIAINGLNQDNTIILEVSDNGRGISEENRERAMERFVRLDESRTTQGSGLGLSLVAAIAGQHGGSLKLTDANPGLRAQLHFHKIK